MMNRINLFLLKRALNVSALFFLLSSFSFCIVFSNIDSKCLWIEKEYLIDSLKINSVINFVEENDINKVFCQVRSRGDALYESSLVPRYEKLDTLFDPLNYFLEKIENKNIEFHAWFNTYILWSEFDQPSDSSHFYYLCDECFEEDLNGKSDKNIILSQNQSKNWEGVFLSPSHPIINNYLLSIVDELINNYDIDGIHLDYVRYQDSFYGYNKEGLSEFINLNNFNPKDLDRGIISKRFGFTEEYIDSVKNIWDSFRINKINEFIRSVKYSLINNSLDIKLSAAVKPNYIEAKYRWYQDWLSWINEDLVDFVVLKNYKENLSEFNFCNKLTDNVLSDFDIENKIYIGISAYNQNSYSAVDKIFLSRLMGYKNFSIFSYRVDKDSTNWYNPVIKLLNFNLY